MGLLHVRSHLIIIRHKMRITRPKTPYATAIVIREGLKEKLLWYKRVYTDVDVRIEPFFTPGMGDLFDAWERFFKDPQNHTCWEYYCSFWAPANEVAEVIFDEIERYLHVCCSLQGGIIYDRRIFGVSGDYPGIEMCYTWGGPV